MAFIMLMFILGCLIYQRRTNTPKGLVDSPAQVYENMMASNQESVSECCENEQQLESRLSFCFSSNTIGKIVLKFQLR